VSSNPFHLSVRFIADNGRGEYLVLKRSAKSKHFKNQWELPGGKVDPGESLDVAVLREVKEETGLAAAVERVAGAHDGRVGKKQITFIFFEGRYEDGRVRLSDEHSDYAWLSLEALLALGNELCESVRPFIATFARAHGYDPQPTKKEKPQTEAARRRWLARQVRAFAAARDDYQRLCGVIEARLKEAVARTCPTAFVSARPKNVASFAEKILRKDKYRDPLREITDLVGARVIAQLKSEVDAVCAFVRDNFVIDEKNSLDALGRLRASEFGYRSVHYVVQLRRDRFPGLPERLYSLKAEIQVRTIAQHAWSDIGHDRLYKSGFKVPKVCQREAARIAAMLESADEAFERLVRDLEAYRSEEHTSELQSQSRSRMPSSA
jgi:mutator protein MutT